MKFCIDCKHFTHMGNCIAPENGISLIAGHPKPVFAVVSRHDSTQCGVDGRFWTAKPATQNKPWWKFW